MANHLTLVGPSGEVWTARERRGATVYRDKFTIVFGAGWEQLARCEWTPTTFRLWAHLIHRVSFAGFTFVRQRKLADELGVGQSVIAKSLAVLVDQGWLEAKRDGALLGYRWNIDWVWRGGAPAWHKAKRERVSLVGGGASSLSSRLSGK